MVDVKGAVRIAIQYLQEFNEFIPANAIRLEETEYDDAGSGYWSITLSTLSPDDPGPNVIGNLERLLPRKRSYKVFRIDAKSGEVKSMKVRSLQPIE
jgi:hypothetical protein